MADKSMAGLNEFTAKTENKVDATKKLRVARVAFLYYEPNNERSRSNRFGIFRCPRFILFQTNEIVQQTETELRSDRG